MKKYKILIVDDERTLADMTRTSFPQDQFIAKVAYSGKEALKEVSKDQPDLIILDVMMPGLDGWQVLDQLKRDQKTSSIPVIMCTIKDSILDVEKSYRSGAQSYLIKPFNFTRLLQKVAVILDIEKILSD